MALLYVFIFVTLAFITGLFYSLFAHDSAEVNVFECGIKKNDIPSAYRIKNTFPFIAFLCFDVILVFLICATISESGSSGFLKLLILVGCSVLGLLYKLRVE